MLQLLGRISLALVCVLACSGALLVGVFMTAVEVFAPPHYTVGFHELPEVHARSWLVFDAATGEVLLAEREHEVVPIASITKLPAAAALVRSHDLWEEALIVHQDVVAEGRAGSLALGTRYSLHTLLFPLLLESSNDAAAAIARHAPTVIAEANEHAGALGLKDTRFVDTAGLSSGNVSTAAELAVLLGELSQSEPHVINMTRIPYYVFEGQGWRNNSPFVDDPAYAGGKHGYTPEAKHTAAVLFDEPFEGGTRTLGYIVLGSADLPADIGALRAYVRDHVTYR